MTAKKYIFLTALLLLAMGWLFPNHYHPWPGFYNEAPAGAGAIVAGMGLFLCSVQRFVVVPKGWLIGCASIFIPILSFIGGQTYFLGDALLAAGYLACFLIAFLIAYTNCSGCYSRDETFLALASTFVVVGIVSSVIALRQSFGLNGVIWEVELPVGERPYGNLAQPNQFASLVFMAGLCGYGLYAKRAISGGLLFFLLLPITLGIAIAQSRTSLLTIILLCFMVFLPKIKANLHREGRSCQTLLTCWFVVCVVCWLLWPYIYGFLQNGVAEERASSLLKDGPRLKIWLEMVAALAQKPLLGYGWNQTSFALMSVLADYPQSTIFYSAHNLILDISVWGGIPLAVAVGVLIFWWLLRAYNAMASQEALVFVMAIVVLLVHSLLEFPLLYLYFLVPFGLFVGFVEGGIYVSTTRTVPMSWVGGGVGVLGVVLAGVAWGYLDAEAEIRQLRFEQAKLSLVESELYEPVVGSIFVDQLVALVYASRLPVTENNYQTVDFAFRQAVAYRFPFPRQVVDLVCLLWFKGEQEQAWLELKKIKNTQGKRGYRVAFQDVLDRTQIDASRIPKDLHPD